MLRCLAYIGASFLLFLEVCPSEVMACSPPSTLSLTDEEVEQRAQQDIASSDAVIDAKIASYDWQNGRAILAPSRVWKGQSLKTFSVIVPVCSGPLSERTGVSLRLLLRRASQKNEWEVIAPPDSTWNHGYDQAVDMILGNRRPTGFAHYPVLSPLSSGPVLPRVPEYSPSEHLREVGKQYDACVSTAAREYALQPEDTSVLVQKAEQRCTFQLAQFQTQAKAEAADTNLRFPNLARSINRFVNESTAATRVSAYAEVAEIRQPSIIVP